MAESPRAGARDELPAELLAPLGEIERAVEDSLAGLGAPAGLRDAMAYAAIGGGKRLRPLLAWHACAAAGGRGREALPACVAVELVHCFSLVHDDLPALDDDDLRRGRPTLHVHAGEAMAILAGDALLNHAYAVLVSQAPAELGRRLVAELSGACARMIAGQVLDTLSAGDEGVGSLARLEQIHRGKTGAMFEASVRMGAMLAPRPAETTLAALTRYAEFIGLMFQIVDDLLDVTQSPEHTGKRTGKDARSGKLTYPGVLGIDASRRRVAELRDAALKELGDVPGPARPLELFADVLARRTR